MDASDRLFGELAVGLRVLTREQVSECMDAQQHDHAGKPIGEVACALGFMTQADVERVLANQRKIEARRQKSQPLQAVVQAAVPAPPSESEPVHDGGTDMPSVSEQPQPSAPPVALGRTSIAAQQAQAPMRDPKSADLFMQATQAQPPGSSLQPAAFGATSAAPPPPPPPQPSQRSMPQVTPRHAAEDVESARVPKVRSARPQSNTAIKESYLGKALQAAIGHNASDLHVHSGGNLMIRVQGELRALGRGGPLSAEAAQKIIAEIMTDDQWAQLAHAGEVDFALQIPGVARFRVNAYRQQRGIDAVFRIIPARPPSLQQLGLPERLASLVDFRTGMVLFTGPAGCGKSTTLAALLNVLVQTRSDHVLTVEDPVEFVFPPGPCLVNQRQVVKHTESFARALRAALREDPDIIVITELRDRETMALAISAAETGHLVLGTLHTGNAPQTINRIVSSFPADEQEQIRTMLAESLRAIVSQRLLPGAMSKGRVVALELLMVNTAVSNLIREDKTYQLPSVMQTGKAQGMQTLDDSLELLVQAGEVTREQALRVADKKERFR